MACNKTAVFQSDLTMKSDQNKHMSPRRLSYGAARFHEIIVNFPIKTTVTGGADKVHTGIIIYIYIYIYIYI